MPLGGAACAIEGRPPACPPPLPEGSQRLRGPGRPAGPSLATRSALDLGGAARHTARRPARLVMSGAGRPRLRTSAPADGRRPGRRRAAERAGGQAPKRRRVRPVSGRLEDVQKVCTVQQPAGRLIPGDRVANRTRLQLPLPSSYAQSGPYQSRGPSPSRARRRAEY